MEWQWHQLDHIKSPAPCPRQIIIPAPHLSTFYRTDALPHAETTVSKYWRQFGSEIIGRKKRTIDKIHEKISELISKKAQMENNRKDKEANHKQTCNSPVKRCEFQSSAGRSCDYWRRPVHGWSQCMAQLRSQYTSLWCWTHYLQHIIVRMNGYPLWFLDFNTHFNNPASWLTG